MNAIDLSRRNFLVGASAATGGLTLGFAIPFTDEAAAQGLAPEVNAWVVVKPDDTVVIRIARMEMGQGTLTGLAQLVAEELEADWSKVTTEYPTPGENLARKRIWGNFGTAGSQGIRQSAVYVRQGGAVARMMLVQAAANEWKVPVAECTVAKGVISHKASNRTITYGKVADAAARLEAPKEPALKDPKDWTIAGKPMKRLHQAGKVNGAQIYSIDHKMPGMLNAAVQDCPIVGGKLKSFDASKAEKMPGVKKVVRVENAVAVIADTWWRAKTALEAVKFDYDEGEFAKLDSASIAATLKAGLDAQEAFVGNKAGDAAGAIAGAVKKVEAVYSVPYQHHAPMEPLNATARYTAEKCEVWTATQNAEAALAAVSQAVGLPLDKCDIYRLDLGGGFGRRATSQDFARQAALIAKEMPGVPIKMIWSREEDQRHGTYHPITQCKLTGGLDKDGNLVGLHMRISGQSIQATIRPEDGASEDKFKAARATIKKAGYKAKLGKGVPAGAMKEEAELDEMAQTPARQRDMEHAIQRHDVKAQRGYEAKMNKTGKAAERGRKLEDKHDTAGRRLIARDTKEYESEKLYGRGGKIVKGKRKPVKEAAEQLDEVSPPDMEKMTGSKKTKASFAKQYGKRGKSVMYATAWKLHNKKAGKD